MKHLNVLNVSLLFIFYFLFFFDRERGERYFLYSVDVSMASENTCSMIFLIPF